VGGVVFEIIRIREAIFENLGLKRKRRRIPCLAAAVSSLLL
jgi:hypothetical protein